MCCTGSIVHVNGPAGCVILLLNIFFPGVGTMLSACCGGAGCVTEQVFVGILQLLLAATLIGWIWSIWWGFLIIGGSSDNGGRQDNYTKA